MEKLLEDVTGSVLELSEYSLVDLVERKEEVLIQFVDIVSGRNSYFIDDTIRIQITEVQ